VITGLCRTSAHDDDNKCYGLEYQPFLRMCEFFSLFASYLWSRGDGLCFVFSIIPFFLFCAWIRWTSELEAWGT